MGDKQKPDDMSTQGTAEPHVRVPQAHAQGQWFLGLRGTIVFMVVCVTSEKNQDSERLPRPEARQFVSALQSLFLFGYHRLNPGALGH